MSTYKGYVKYLKERQQRVEAAWKNTEYAERIEPAVKKSGLSKATFIKVAVDEKIDWMN